MKFVNSSKGFVGKKVTVWYTQDSKTQTQLTSDPHSKTMVYHSIFKIKKDIKSVIINLQFPQQLQIESKHIHK